MNYPQTEEEVEKAIREYNEASLDGVKGIDITYYYDDSFFNEHTAFSATDIQTFEEIGHEELENRVMVLVKSCYIETAAFNEDSTFMDKVHLSLEDFLRAADTLREHYKDYLKDGSL